MRRAVLGLVSVGLMAGGIVLIWRGQGCLGCAAMLCGGAAAGLRQATDYTDVGRTALTLGGFVLFLVGGFSLYAGQTGCGIVITLLASLPWWLGRSPGEAVSAWMRFFAFACFALWTFGAALLFKGKGLEGGILLGASIIPWYAMESMRGGRVILSVTLLGEVIAWCGAAAALAHGNYPACAVLIAFFLVSRLIDDYLLVRKGHTLSEADTPLSFRAYLDLDRDEARRLRAVGAQGEEPPEPA